MMDKNKKVIKIDNFRKSYKRKIYIKRIIVIAILIIILIIIKVSISSLTYGGKYKQTIQNLKNEYKDVYKDYEVAALSEEYKNIKINYIFPEFEDQEVANMVKNQLKEKAYKTVDSVIKEDDKKTLAVIYSGSNVSDKILSYSIIQRIYEKDGSNMNLESEIKDPRIIADARTGNIYDIKDIFRSDIDPMPSIEERTKEAIIATKKIPIEKIGEIGTWDYAEDIVGSGIFLSDKGLEVPVNDPDGRIESINIPLNQLVGVVKSEFLDENSKNMVAENLKKRDKETKMIAITFNNSLEDDSMAKALDMLKKSKSKATFYVLGQNASKKPKALERAIKESHEIGSNTWSQKNLTEIKDNEIYQEVLKSKYSIYNSTGTFTRTLRPPYAAINSDSADIANTPIVMWSLDARDWNSENAKEISDRIIENAKTGDIIVFHSTNDTSIKAAEQVINKLKKDKYEFVTVSELLSYSMYPGYAYHSVESIRNLEEEKELE